MKNSFITFTIAIAMAAHGTAHAGTSTSTVTATLTVVNQCSIAGANIDLGTFLATQTWGDVADATGYEKGPGLYWYGLLTNNLNMGSITCDSGTPFTFRIRGTGEFGTARIAISTNVAQFTPFVNNFNRAYPSYPDDSGFPSSGWGAQATGATSSGVPGVGTGAEQQIIGSLIMRLGGSLANNINSKSIADATPLATSGTYADTLTYQLDF